MTFLIFASNLIFKNIIILVFQFKKFINNNRVFISFINQNTRQLIIRIIKNNFRLLKINKEVFFIKKDRVKIKSNFTKSFF